MKDFILNAWYMAAWSEEITSSLFSRKLLGQAVLLTRGENGDPVALRDRCPHRFAPLSLGRREGGLVSCGYHGLTFDLDGQCVHNPYSANIPGSAVVQRYRAVEKDDIFWVWFGDAERADPALIPDFSATAPRAGATRVNGHTLMNANYEFGTDNLLDLSHIEYLHSGTFGGDGAIFKGKHSVEQNGNRLQSNWWMPGVPCPAGLDYVLQSDVADRWLDMRWDPPASMYLEVGATLPGRPREEGSRFDQTHILTPADIGESYYFWSSSAPFEQPPEQASMFREMLRMAFDVEDKPMIEAAYHNIHGDFWAERPISLGIDAGGTRARRIIEGMKHAERTLDDQRATAAAVV